jgi:peptide-methionine (S)-S-oxide reductase
MMILAKERMPSSADALPGRADAMPVPEMHFVNGNRLKGPFPKNLDTAMFGLGCFWGAEKLFWLIPGIYSTQAGYAGGLTLNATYREVCSGMTGHNEVVRVQYDPAQVSYGMLLSKFWEGHDPTQGMRQGGDIGTQYRSGIYTYNDVQVCAAEASKAAYQVALSKEKYGQITTEIVLAPTFYYAEDYHQQYLAKNPGGYCGHGGTEVACPAFSAGSHQT